MNFHHLRDTTGPEHRRQTKHWLNTAHFSRHRRYNKYFLSVGCKNKHRNYHTQLKQRQACQNLPARRAKFGQRQTDASLRSEINFGLKGQQIWKYRSTLYTNTHTTSRRRRHHIHTDSTCNKHRYCHSLCSGISHVHTRLRTWFLGLAHLDRWIIQIFTNSLGRGSIGSNIGSKMAF